VNTVLQTAIEEAEMKVKTFLEDEIPDPDDFE
jgi:hypothetical protein